MKGKKVISRLTKVFYALGIVMLLSGMMLSAITSPALAQEQATQAADEGGEETSSDPTATPAPTEDPTEEPGEEDDSGEPVELQVAGPAAALKVPELSSVCAEDGSVEWYVTGQNGGETLALTSTLFSGVLTITGNESVLVFTGTANSAYSVSVTWTALGGETGELSDEATVDMCGTGDDEPEWSKSSLSFDGGCDGDCEEVSAQVCNVGDGDMSGSVEYNVYYAVSGNPKDGTVVDTGSVGPLASGECDDLTYTPTEDGNYMFQAFQEAGHPGNENHDLWSEQCSIDQCSVPEGEGDFYWSLNSDPDSPSCEFTAVQMCTTFVVEAQNIPDGYTVVLQTTFNQVWPDNGDDKVYANYTLGEGLHEVEVCGLWPGIGDGDHTVEIHFGGKLFLVDGNGQSQDLSGGNFDAEGVDIWYQPWMKEQCSIPEEPELEITETCPDYVNMLNNFTVSNTGTVDADFTWESTNGESGTGSVATGSTTSISTTRGLTPDTVTIYFGNYGENSATAMTDEEAELAECTLPEKPSLIINATCPDYDNSLNSWLVTNTGNVAADFAWSSSEIGSGSGSVGIGETASFTTPRGATVETVTVSYGDGKTASADSMTDEEAEAAECALPEKPSLTIIATCPDFDNSLNSWLVTNTGNVAADFTWSSSEIGNGSGSVGIGETASFTTPRGATVETVTVSYGDGKTASADSMTDEEAEEAECALPEKPSLTIISTCPDFDNSLNAWLITNTGSVAVDFTWSSSEIGSGSGSVGIGETASFTTPRGETVETVTVSYGDGKTASADSMTDEEAEDAECEVPQAPILGLTSTCPDYLEDLNNWTITNIGPVTASYSWTSTTGESGSGTLNSGESVNFSTDRSLGPDDVTVTYGTDKSITKTAMTDEQAAEEQCEMPPELEWSLEGEGDYAPTVNGTLSPPVYNLLLLH